MTNVNIPLFSGAAGAADSDSTTITVNVYTGFSAAGIPTQTLTTTAHSGSWSVSADAPLEDGTYTARATQRDEVGNVGESIAGTFTIDTTPPGPVTSLRVVPASDGLHITWKNPSDGDYTGAMIRRSEGNMPPSSPTSGTLVATTPAGNASLDDNTVTLGQTYSYAVFAYDEVPNYAVGTVATQTMPACTDSWTGNAGTLDWSTAGNWSKDQAPEAADVACVFGSDEESPVNYATGASIVSQLVATRPITLTGGELDLATMSSASVTTDLHVSGGSIGGSGNLVLDGESIWESGNLLGSGDTAVPAGSTLIVADASCGGCAKVGDGHTLTVGGTLNVVGASELYLEGKAQLVNSGTVDFEGDGRIDATVEPSSLFVNQGALEKGGGGASVVASLFDNAGSVSVAEGALDFSGANSEGASDSGSYATTGGASILFEPVGSRVLGSHVSLTGTVEWYDGEISGAVPAGSTLIVADASCGGCAKVGDGHTLTVGGTLGVLGNSQLVLEKGSAVIFKADSVFKAGQGVSLNIPSGATLNSEGTEEHPVTFTAIADDTVGSHINHMAVIKPSAGEWSGIEIVDGGAIPSNTNLGYMEIRYATTALALRGEGNVAVRGAFISDLKAVEACNWGAADCSVDAAYTYWGGSEGPFPGGSPPLTCGAVTTSPYLTSATGGATASAKSAFGSANCDSSPTPEEQLASAEASANAHISGEEIRCGEGFREACEVIETYKKCLGAATKLAEENSQFKLNNLAENTASLASDFLMQSEQVLVKTTGEVASFGLGIFGAAKVILGIANAYNTCA